MLNTKVTCLTLNPPTEGVQLPRLKKHPGGLLHNHTTLTNYDDIQIKPGYAPFMSTSPRQGKKKRVKQQVQTPGPGQYEVSRPLVKPLIETIQKTNNNIIIKIHQSGSAAFRDGSERFKVKQPEAPGPGQYKTIEVEKDLLTHHGIQNSLHQYRQRFKEVFDQPRSPSISAVKVLSTSREMVNRIESNREHYIRRRISLQQKGPNWAKYSEQRFKLQAPLVPGPGSYEHTKTNIIKPIGKHLPSSSFASQSVRSFFDNIYFETNQQAKAVLREKINYKSQSPGPGAYINQQYDAPKQMVNKFQFFGSTEERNLEPTPQPEKPKRQKSIKIQNLKEQLQRYENHRIKNSYLVMENPRTLDEAVSQLSEELSLKTQKPSRIFQRPQQYKQFS